ncbi:MAG: NusG domain II-containing protein [Verrucomicrobia bacterium]|nr:MAG: NusG domain II-containing protein [Verrucomicrobiota bacterium]
MVYQTCGMNVPPDKNLYTISRGDYVLAGAVLALAITAIAATLHRPADAEARALIHVGTAPVQELDLATDRMVTNLVAGHMAEFEINTGRIRVREITCPQKLCQHTGWISRPGEMIVCVPNKILIEVTAQSGHSDYDAVSH